MSTPFMGQIEIFSFNFAPKGWTQCNGQLLPINQNQALFSLLGTMYGGNGQTTFGLPDLRGRIPISFGQNTQGAAMGQEFHTLTVAELATHNHMQNVDAKTASGSNKNSPDPTELLGQSSGITSTGTPLTINVYGKGAPGTALDPRTIGNTGGSQPHENRMPFTVLNLCIALQGIFPSRN